MTRRQLKEEVELRKYVLGPEHPMAASVVRSMIAAFIRAVRADEREKCAKAAKERTWDPQLGDNIAAAIRWEQNAEDIEAHRDELESRLAALEKVAVEVNKMPYASRTPLLNKALAALDAAKEG
jgi:hypothetical protein